jgi:hypothetical protein
LRPAAPIQRLPNELLLQIFGALPAAEISRVARVDKTWHYLVHEPTLQRRIFEPELRQPLASLQDWYQRQQAGEADGSIAALYAQPPPGPSKAAPMSLQEVHRRLVDARKRPAAPQPSTMGKAAPESQPVAAEPSVMRIAARARQATRQLQRCEWAAWSARCFAPSVWNPLVKVAALGFGASAFLCDQGSMNAAPLLLDLGILLGAYTLLFALFSPVLWLLYNCAGVLVEEWAFACEMRLQASMQGEFAIVAALLQPQAATRPRQAAALARRES